MFFTVSPVADQRLPFHQTMGDSGWIFSHDSGWSNDKGSWKKGYQCTTIDHGNWTSVSLQGSRLQLDHDRHRAYPLWWDDDTKTLTNLLGTGRHVWADKKVVLTGGNIIETPVDVYGSISYDLIDTETAARMIIENLTPKIKDLIDSQKHLPKKLFVTGGVDTILLYAMIKKWSIDCEIVTYEHIEYDKFLDDNFESIKKNHWGYRQIHHWKQPCMLLTGGCGDEFFMRGPTTVAFWAAWNDINVESVVTNAQGYHRGYFLKDENLSIFQKYFQNRSSLREQYPKRSDMIEQILNINVNDHQHWHLGETLTWTPFKDLEILKIILRLDRNSMIDHIIDASVSRRVIEMLWPDAIDLVSKTKNYRNRENLYRLYD